MDAFEIACDEIDDEIRDYDYEQENVIEFIRGSKIATVTFTQGRYITKVLKLADRFPNLVQICNTNKGKNGEIKSIVAHLPVRAIKINLSEPRTLTDEQRQANIERLARARGERQDELPFK